MISERTIRLPIRFLDWILCYLLPLPLAWNLVPAVTKLDRWYTRQYLILSQWLARIASDIRRANRHLSAGPLVDAWLRIDRSTTQIAVTKEAEARDGIDLSPAGIAALNQLRPDVRVRGVFHNLRDAKTHLLLAWRAAVLLLVLSLPAVVAAAPPVSQIGPRDDGEGFRLVRPIKPILPIEIPDQTGSDQPPPKIEPEVTAAPGPTVPPAVIQQALLDVLGLPEVAAEMSAAAKSQTRRIGCFTAPGCGPCNQQKTEWGGQPAADGVEVTYYVRQDWTLPDWVPPDARSFPCTFTMDTVNSNGQTVYAYAPGYRTWAQMREFLAEHRPPGDPGKLVGTVTLGSIKGKAQVAQAFKLLSQMGPGQMTLSWQVAHAPKIGTADGGLEVNGAGSVSYSWDSERMRVAFKPPLRLVSRTWIGRVSQPVSGALIEHDRFTIEMPGMIDVAKRLVE